MVERATWRADAVGWDWTGINLDDGGALMAFRIRDAQGAATWAGGAYRDAAGTTHIVRRRPMSHSPPQRRWRSPRTGIRISGRRARARRRPSSYCWSRCFDDQELDARASVGTVYWEGAVRASSGGRIAGRGYLELTGYGGALRL